MGNLIPKFVDLVKGNYSKRFLICILIPIMIGVMILFYTLAIISFPNYNWTLHQISELGDPSSAENPTGWFYWAIAMIWVGICLIPLVPYIYKHLRPFSRRIIYVGTFFFTLAVIGNLGIGAILDFPA